MGLGCGDGEHLMTAAVVNTSVYADSTATASQVVTLPASIVAGNLLLMFITLGSAGGGSITTPSGWTQLAINTVNWTGAILYKTATGSEGASVTITTTIRTAAAVCYQINAWAGTPAVSVAKNASSGASITPNAITPSWGSASDLFIEAVMAGGDEAPISSYSSGYGSPVASNAGNFCLAATAIKSATETTETPGAITMKYSEASVAWVVAIQPSAVAARAYDFFKLFF